MPPRETNSTGLENVPAHHQSMRHLLHRRDWVWAIHSFSHRAILRCMGFDANWNGPRHLGVERARLVEKVEERTLNQKMARGIVASCVGSFVLSLCACGGGGGSPAEAPAVQQPVVKSVLIEAYGDSTTQGFQTVNGAGVLTPNSEPAALQKLLQAQFGPSVTVSNQGVSGTEASQLLNGTDGVHGSWLNQMASSKADIVTINFELNDAFFSKVPTPGAIPESPSDYASYMTQLVQVAKAAGKHVILFEPNPTIEPLRVSLAPSYLVALQSVADAQNVPLVPEYDAILSTPNWQSMLTDEVHPNDALYAIKAQLEFPTISTVVASLLTSQ